MLKSYTIRKIQPADDEHKRCPGGFFVKYSGDQSAMTVADLETLFAYLLNALEGRVEEGYPQHYGRVTIDRGD